jgi:hypothetical protein
MIAIDRERARAALLRIAASTHAVSLQARQLLDDLGPLSANPIISPLQATETTR